MASFYNVNRLLTAFLSFLLSKKIGYKNIKKVVNFSGDSVVVMKDGTHLTLGFFKVDVDKKRNVREWGIIHPNTCISSVNPPELLSEKECLKICKIKT